MAVQARCAATARCFLNPSARSVLAVVMFVAIVGLPLQVTAQTMPARQKGTSRPTGTAAIQSPAPDASPTAYLLTCLEERELTLFSFPGSGVRGQSPVVRLVGRIDDRWFQPIGVYRGHMLCKVRGGIHAVDLHTGVVRVLFDKFVLAAFLSNEQLHFVTAVANSDQAGDAYSLVHLDLATLEQTVLCELQLGGGSGWDAGFSLAVSPDGRLAAVTESSEKVDRSNLDCRIVVAGLNTTIKRSEFEFSNLTVLTGAGVYVRSPRLGWADNETIVIADHAPSEDQHSAMMGLPIAMHIRTIKLPALAVSDVLDLPETAYSRTSPALKRLGDSRLVADLGRRGPFLVDLKQNQLREYRELGGGYRLEGSSLFFDDKLLDANTDSHKVFPTGKSRIAWLPNALDPVPRRPPNGAPYGELTLKIHDAAEGQYEVFTGCFHQIVPSLNPYLCVWINDEDYEHSDVFDQLPVYEPPEPRINVDIRPALAECVSVEVQTDEHTYLRHEPVVATIKVTNLTDKLIRFESKHLLHGGQPFDLEVSVQGSHRKIEVFDDYRNKPNSEFFDLLPGKVKSVDCEFETEETGTHELKLRFQHGRWSGRAIVKTEFEVLNEFSGEELQAKFDRLIAFCAQRIEQGTNHFSSSLFAQLGPEGVPLMIAYLRQCPDAQLRAELERTLAYTETVETLRYIREVANRAVRLSQEWKSEDPDLADIKQIEAQAVASSLFNLCSYRSRVQSELAKESRKALAEISSSATPEIRRAIVDTFTGVVHDDIDQLMIRAASDSDSAVAVTAARYVAYRQELPLRDWFAWASENPNDVSLHAARSIIAQLEKTWKVDLGELPNSVSAIRSEEEKWKSTLDNWIRWCDRNQRISLSFFDVDREKAERMQRAMNYWTDDNGPTPIQLSGI